jgi:hypothetical protein
MVPFLVRGVSPPRNLSSPSPHFLYRYEEYRYEEEEEDVEAGGAGA